MRNTSSSKYSEFKHQYNNEISERFSNNENHKIAKKLRQIFLHRKLPSVFSTFAYTRETGIDIAFVLSIPSLLEWNGWNAKERKILKNMGDTFRLGSFVHQYFLQVESFHKWLWAEQEKLHYDDLERLNNLKREANLAFKKAGLIKNEMLNEFNSTV